MPPDAGDQKRIATYLATLRKRLVDLTGRNRLINFRPQKRSSLELLHPNVDGLWRNLVQDESRLRLVTGITEEIDESTGEPVTSELAPQSAASLYRRGQAPIRANEKNFNASANVIRRQAAELMDETGTNSLYLALGFLRWFESRDSSIERTSPLILVPVNIHFSRGIGENADPNGHYDLEHDGNEVTGNLSLNLRLEADFGLSLPSVNDETNPRDFMERVREIASQKPRWDVIESVHLAFFSFAKLRMYQDLDPTVWPEGNSLLDNSLVRDLLDGSERIEECPAYGPVEVHDEHETAHEIPLVCEADSSQHTAILKVLDGRNTVIEGPPGTGKSQTITNIVAAALARGKTVLFVSEKKAALDVVYDNLQRRGLADFCLELHASKSNKGTVHESFQKRQRASFPAPIAIAQTRQEWQACLESIVAYLKAMAASGGPWAESLHCSMGRAIFHRSEGLPSYREALNGSLPTPEQLQRRLHLLLTFSTHIHNPEDFRDHPWKGFQPTLAGPGDEHAIESRFAKLFERVRAMRDIETNLDQLSGSEDSLPHTLVAKAFLNFPHHLADSIENVYGAALPGFRDLDTIAAIEQVLEKRDAFHEERAIALKTLSDATVACEEDLAASDDATSTLVNLGFSDHSIAELMGHLPSLEECVDVFGTLEQIAARIEFYGLGKIRCIGHLEAVRPLLELAANQPGGLESMLYERLLFPSTRDVFEGAKRTSTELFSRKAKLAETFVITDAESPLDIDSRRKVLRATGGSIFSIFNRDYREARRAVLGYLQHR